MVKKINELIKVIERTPFEGTGKPEPLKYDLAGCWSRRLDQEHRLVIRLLKMSFLVMLAYIITTNNQ
ncbi:MAG: Txe/YoeB family addiction module toxin [Candidatus Cyclobacteriaceae bacterium M3_2C_046]